MDDLAIWKRLLEPANAPLRAAAAAIDATDVAAVARIRTGHDPDLVAAALRLAAARRDATRKFPDRPELVADPEGVEQSSSAALAAHKAARFRRTAERGPILDLCCGIGGDAMQLATAGPLLGVDLDPLRAWMCAENAGCPTRVADVADLPVAGALVHLDPERRDPATGRRLLRYADCRPGPAVIARIVAESDGAAIKLGPGVDPAELPGSGRSELEFISEGGTLVQAVLWSGALAEHPGARRATRLPEGVTLVGTPAPLPGATSCGAWISKPDPALERAGLVALAIEGLPLGELAAGLGIVTGPVPGPAPWFDACRVIEQIPWRLRPLRARLAALGAGEVVVRTRGGAVDADEAARQLRGSGDRRFVVYGLRLGRRRVAIIAHPPDAAPA